MVSRCICMSKSIDKRKGEAQNSGRVGAMGISLQHPCAWFKSVSIPLDSVQKHLLYIPQPRGRHDARDLEHKDKIKDTEVSSGKDKNKADR